MNKAKVPTRPKKPKSLLITFIDFFMAASFPGSGTDALFDFSHRMRHTFSHLLSLKCQFDAFTIINNHPITILTDFSFGICPPYIGTIILSIFDPPGS
jgi:hypothetical protein